MVIIHLAKTSSQITANQPIFDLIVLIIVIVTTSSLSRQLPPVTGKFGATAIVWTRPVESY